MLGLLYQSLEKFYLGVGLLHLLLVLSCTLFNNWWPFSTILAELLRRFISQLVLCGRYVMLRQTAFGECMHHMWFLFCLLWHGPSALRAFFRSNRALLVKSCFTSQTARLTTHATGSKTIWLEEDRECWSMVLCQPGGQWKEVFCKDLSWIHFFLASLWMICLWRSINAQSASMPMTLHYITPVGTVLSC